MAEILGGKTFLLRRPAASKLTTTYGAPPDERLHVIVRLDGPEGTFGWGEASPLPRFTGETAESIQQMIERGFFPRLRGADGANPKEVQDRLESIAYGNTAAKAALDMARYDLEARTLGVPEYVLLGGRRRESVRINRHIGITSEGEAVASAKSFVDQGYRSIKMKAGVDPSGDVRRIRAVRQAVGGDVDIRVDANQGYDFPAARRVLSELRDERVQFFEQPLPREDWKGLKELREWTDVPIAADESLCSAQDALFLAENRCVDVFILKLIKSGGLGSALDIATIARCAGIRCVVTSVFDTQLGAAHCLHLAASLPDVLSCDLTCFASQGEMAESAHELKDGSVYVGSAPGCGVTRLAELDLVP